MRDASFHLLDRAAWPRSEHFDYYIRTVKCRYDLTAHLAVTALRERGKALGLRFYPLLLYIAARAINANREFRMGFNEHGAPGYWDFINPSYTIFHDDDKTFSDVWSEYDESFPVFYQNVLHDMETYKDIKGVRAKPGRPANCCPMSALPWLSFTGMAHVQAAVGERRAVVQGKAGLALVLFEQFVVKVEFLPVLQHIRLAHRKPAAHRKARLVHVERLFVFHNSSCKNKTPRALAQGDK